MEQGQPQDFLGLIEYVYFYIRRKPGVKDKKKKVRQSVSKSRTPRSPSSPERDEREKDRGRR